MLDPTSVGSSSGGEGDRSKVLAILSSVPRTGLGRDVRDRTRLRQGRFVRDQGGRVSSHADCGPTNPQPTLTKSLSTLRKDASDWTVALPDLPKGAPALETLINLMRSIMRAHSSRHAGPAARIPYAVEAESVVHLAVAIVQMLSLGGLQKVKPTAES